MTLAILAVIGMVAGSLCVGMGLIRKDFSYSLMAFAFTMSQFTIYGLVT